MRNRRVVRITSVETETNKRPQAVSYIIFHNQKVLPKRIKHAKQRKILAVNCWNLAKG